MSPRTIEIRAATPDDREAILALLRNRWGGETMVVQDTVYRPADLPAFVAVDRARRTKPSIPLIGYHGIPIRDEITLVKNLEEAESAASGGAA